MKKAAVVLGAVALIATSFASARADTAVGAVFGYPGNVGLSLRFDRTPIGAAWSSDFIHATIDRWVSKKPFERPDMAWYYGPGADVGLPLDDAEEFFLALRVPVGIQWMASPKLEVFGEVAPGFQILDETDFYLAASVGVRFVLGN